MTLDEMIEAGARGHFKADWDEDWTVQNEVRQGAYLDTAKVVLIAAGVPALIAERDALLARVRTLEAAINSANRKIAHQPLDADGVPIFWGENIFAVVQMNYDPPAEEIVECGFVEMKEEGGTVRDANGGEYDVDYDHCYHDATAAAEAMKPTALTPPT